MKWNRRKIRMIKKRLTGIENYCDEILFYDKDKNTDSSFYSYEKKALQKLREEIVLAHNNFRASLEN